MVWGRVSGLRGWVSGQRPTPLRMELRKENPLRMEHRKEIPPEGVQEGDSPVNRETPVKTLLSPLLRMRSVTIIKTNVPSTHMLYI